MSTSILSLRLEQTANTPIDIIFAGEMTSAHKNILVNGFLCGTRDPDPLVRASSLSCLGELCKVLGFRLGNIIVEVTPFLN